MINYSENEQNKRRNKNNSILVGAILIVIGCVFALYNMQIIPWEIKNILISWQMLLIIIGIFSLSSGNKTPGIILIVIGSFFIIPKLSHLIPGLLTISAQFTNNFWPILLIVVGLIVIFTSRNHNNKNQKTNSNYDSTNTNDNSGNSSYERGYIHCDCTFSGSKIVFSEPILKGGSVSSTFGGAVIDLRYTSLDPTNIPCLNIKILFGGVTILVPDDWSIEIRKSAIFGGFIDNRYVKPYSGEKQHLIIKVDCLFGGGEIKSNKDLS